MSATSTRSKSVTHQIGALCFGGDWAIAHGDAAGLRQVALQLAAYMEEPVHCELVELANTCNSDPDRAVQQWSQLKDHLYQASM